MSNRYQEYVINTDNTARTKAEIHQRLHDAASILLTISGYENGETVTREINFAPEEVPKNGFVFSRGMVEPEHTEASIIEEDEKYLVLVASLKDEN